MPAAVLVTVPLVAVVKVLALLVPVLPAPSAWLACAVYWVFALSALLAGTDQVPPDSVVVSVWTRVPLVFAPW